MTTPADAENDAPTHRSWADRLSLARRWSGWILAIYAVAQFTGTHLPNPPSVIEIEGNDKFLHWGAYFGLAFLLATWRSSKADVTRRALLLIWCLTAVLAMFDEITQLIPGVNRDADVSDWIADMLGSACGLLTWFVLRRKLFPPVTWIASEQNHEVGGQ